MNTEAEQLEQEARRTAEELYSVGCTLADGSTRQVIVRRAERLLTDYAKLLAQPAREGMNAESKPEIVSVPRVTLQEWATYRYGGSLQDEIAELLAATPAPAAPQEAKPCELCGGNGNALYQLLKLREPK